MALDAPKVGDTNLNQQGSDGQADVNENVTEEIFANMEEATKPSGSSAETNAANDSYMTSQGFPAASDCLG